MPDSLPTAPSTPPFSSSSEMAAAAGTVVGACAASTLRVWAGRWSILLLVAAIFAFAPSSAWAQSKKKQTDEPAERGYTTPYAIVLGIVALGMVLVCLPTPRAKAQLDEDQGGFR